jgi:hypothetical protein
MCNSYVPLIDNDTKMGYIHHVTQVTYEICMTDLYSFNMCINRNYHLKTAKITKLI